MALVAQLAAATLAEANIAALLCRGLPTLRHWYICWYGEQAAGRHRRFGRGKGWLPACIGAATDADWRPGFFRNTVLERRAIQAAEVVPGFRLVLHVLRLAGAGADFEAYERVEHVLCEARQADALLYLFRQTLLLTVIVLLHLLDRVVHQLLGLSYQLLPGVA